MKSKILQLLICISLMFFGFEFNVFAAGYAIDDGTSNEYSEGFANNNPTLNVDGSGTVQVYGKSVCSAAQKKCTYTYQASSGTNVDNLLSKAVKCAGGQKNISYDPNVSSGGTAYKGDYNESTDKTVYWSEDYYITCVDSNNSSGSGNSGNNVSLISSGSQSTQNPADDDSDDSSSNNSDNSNTPTTTQYSSSTTVDNSSTGIETYYIVLGIIAIVTYVFMFFAKKYNLFKSI